MKRILPLLVSTLLMVVSLRPVFGQGATRIIGQETPEIIAQRQRHGELLERARIAQESESFDEALGLFRQASQVADSLPGFSRIADYHLAFLLIKLQRNEEAAHAFSRVFKWSEDKGDLVAGAGPVADLGYTICLVKLGRIQDAKHMYYFALRNLTQNSRRTENLPFLVIFDEELHGVVWDLTPQRLEAAATMIKAMVMGDEAYRKIAAELAPDWFYPVLWNGNANRIARAGALAKPGLERELYAKFKGEYDAYVAAHPDDRSLFGFYSQRYTEGAERRARMQCLRPNPVILKRLCRPSQ